MELNRSNLVDAVLDHLAVKAINFALLRDRDLAEVFEHQRDDGFSWWRCDDRARVAHCLSEVRQSTTVIQMEVCD